MRHSSKILCMWGGSFRHDSCPSKGIIHRDLKPQNVLLTKDEFARLQTSGAVAFAETSLTQTNLCWGVHYLSPKCRLVDRKHQSDICNYGYYAFEMLTGHIAYDGDSAVTIASSIFKSPPIDFGSEP